MDVACRSLHCGSESQDLLDGVLVFEFSSLLLVRVRGCRLQLLAWHARRVGARGTVETEQQLASR
eukprot:2479259-Rhodomonas_salina.1